MRKTIVFTILIFFFSYNPTFSQPTLEWVSTVRIGDLPIPIKLMFVQDRIVLLANSSTGNYFLNYDENGNILWKDSIISQSRGDFINDENGSLYFTTQVSGDICTIKYDKFGTREWTRYYNDTNNSIDQGKLIAIGSGSSIVVAGISNSAVIQLIKYSLDGTKIWEKRLTGGPTSIYNNPHAIIMDSVDNIYLTFESDTLTATPNYRRAGVRTVKLDSSSNIIWYDFYRPTTSIFDYASPNSIFFENGTGNIIIGGEISLNGLLLIKYSSQGEKIWLKSYGEAPNIALYNEGVSLDLQNNIYITGYNNSYPYYAYWITVKFDSTGKAVWERRLTSLYVNASSVASDIITEGNTIYVTGSVADSSSGFYGGSQRQICILGYSTFGETLFTELYGTSSYNDYGSCLYVDPAKNIYVSGRQDSAFNLNRICLIKYSQSTGVQIVSNEVPTNFSLHQNYPNPFNPSTRIKFDIPKGGLVKLKIYDLLGREVAELVNEKLNAGVYEYEWSAPGGGAGLTSGVYFYRLQAEEFIETKRMVLVK